jgi:hypothetical protein
VSCVARNDAHSNSTLATFLALSITNVVALFVAIHRMSLHG